LFLIIFKLRELKVYFIAAVESIMKQ